MNLYRSQRNYFKGAYSREETPWPKLDPTPQVEEFLQYIQKEKAGGRMLDLGCGEGRHSFLFQKAGFRAFGIDYQPAALRKALYRRKTLASVKSHRDGPSFLAADVFHLPFLPSIFDVVLDYGCLHHIRKSDFKTYLKNLLAMLKPEGFYILSCFSTEYKHRPDEKRTRDWLVHKGHYDRFFSKREFPQLFGQNFKIVKILKEKNGLNAFFHVLMKKK